MTTESDISQLQDREDQVIRLLADSLKTLNTTLSESMTAFRKELGKVVTKVDSGFTGIRSDLMKVQVVGAIVTVVNTLLMFALVGSTIFIQHRESTVMLNGSLPQSSYDDSRALAPSQTLWPATATPPAPSPSNPTSD